MNFGVIGTGDIGDDCQKVKDAGYPVKRQFERARLTQRARGENWSNTCFSRRGRSRCRYPFLVLPQRRFHRLPKGLLNKARKETIVLMWELLSFRDGPHRELENGLTEQCVV